MELWEESDAHVPVAGHAQLISNGRHFREVFWHLQPQLVQAELVPPSPVSPICQSNIDDQKVPSSPEPAVPTQENQGASRSPISSPKYSFQYSRASSHRESTPCLGPAARRSPSPALSVASTRTSTTCLSDEQARQFMKTWIENSRWLHKDEKEPVIGAPGVPTCALRLADKGQSIYCCFLVPEKDRKGKILGYKCASDPTSTRDRLHRAIGRERVKYGHRPFKCPRQHDPNW